MRLFSLSLALVVAIVLPLQAQQLPSPLHAERPGHSASAVEILPMNTELPATPVVAPQTEAQVAVEEGTVRQTSARNLFAIIGVVVVAVALFAMFR
ncbi:MAG: hypothetical protein H0U67_15270 [Gemmatimonadetes bacterium]|nr:hypothetical protein [Gemmatimonadota bacterium]